jgi:hypothetical protein
LCASKNKEATVRRCRFLREQKKEATVRRFR